MAASIKSVTDLKSREEVGDPYLARMYHIEYYPEGNGQMGVPKKYLEGKNIGSDFDETAEWRMYHGEEVPGFPYHPHRGFETITIVMQGYIDHFDSSGLACRYGYGDVQWMTAGSGLQHSETFPLVHDDKKNTLELFQVWLNLTSDKKLVKPHYQMFWAEEIPVAVEENESGSKAVIKVIAGAYKGKKSLDPNPDSWANDSNHHVGILQIHMEPGSQFSLPAVSTTLNRNLYFYRGSDLTIDETRIKSGSSIKLAGDREITVLNGDTEGYLLLLEGEPLKEPVVNYGPFVMNTREEIEQAYKDYQENQFGGWPWDRKDPVNPKEMSRFAKYGNEKIEYPPSKAHAK
jgi:quercetin 2,3-dioxygenase